MGAAAAPVEVTLGFGPSLFDGRFGLEARRPPGFAPLPVFAGDRLDAARSGGDLMLQVCGEDPIAVHAALRLMTSAARGGVRVRCSSPRTVTCGCPTPPSTAAP